MGLEHGEDCRGAGGAVVTVKLLFTQVCTDAGIDVAVNV